MLFQIAHSIPDVLVQITYGNNSILPPPPPAAVKALAQQIKANTFIADDVDSKATNNMEGNIDIRNNQAAYLYSYTTPKTYCDITTKEEESYQLSALESLNKSQDEVALMLNQMNAEASATDHSDSYNDEYASYQVTNVGTTQYTISNEMFDALVDAWNNKKALTMPLANGDKILSFIYDGAASTPSKRIIQVTTKDIAGKEHQFTLEIKMYQ